MWFRILAVSPEDQSSVPSTHTEMFTAACNQSPGDQAPSCGPWILMCKYTYRLMNNEVFVKRKSVQSPEPYSSLGTQKSVQIKAEEKQRHHLYSYSLDLFKMIDLKNFFPAILFLLGGNFSNIVANTFLLAYILTSFILFLPLQVWMVCHSAPFLSTMHNKLQLIRHQYGFPQMLIATISS